MADIPQRIDASILYSYEWSAYYYQSDYENVLYSYFDLLQEIGYKYIATEKMDSGSTCYLFEGNKLSVVFICSDTEMFIDVCKI